MDRLSLAEEVATRLVAAERAIDAALQAQAHLVAGLLQARATARLAAPAGDAAVMCAAAAAKALGSARSETADCHRALAELQSALRLPPLDVGQGDKDPPEQPHKPRASAAASGAG
ncbi:MAG: hypothetical protein INR64_07335 [Caulobacteraceae bacterium]|nr:hypothetical protein [Caulobacter sp.]